MYDSSRHNADLEQRLGRKFGEDYTNAVLIPSMSAAARATGRIIALNHFLRRDACERNANGSTPSSTTPIFHR